MRYLFLILVLSLSAGWSYAAVPLQFKDYMGFQYPRHFQSSPDGKSFVLEMTVPDFEASKWRKQLWLTDRESGKSRRLTYSGYSDNDARYSPDGKHITFVSTRPLPPDEGLENIESSQLWTLPVSGGEARPLTHLEEGVDDYHWSHDGHFLVILSAEKPDTETVKRNELLEKLKFDETVKDSIHINKVFWKLDMVSGKMDRIAVLDPGVESYTISPDNQWVVYETNYTGKYDDDQKYDLWALNLNTAQKTQITNFPGPETNPRFSPDNKWLAYIKQTTPNVEFAETDLAVIRFNPEHQTPDTVNLTSNFNRSVTDYRWQKDNKSFVVQIADGTETPLYLLKMKNKHGDLQKLTAVPGNVDEFSLSPATGDISCLWEDPLHLPEIAVLKDGKPDFITTFSHQLSQYNTGSQKLYRWKSVDDSTIEGLLFLPPNFDSAKKYPLILLVHGGPYGRFRNVFRQYDLPQVYTDNGYVVFAPNPRGSSGYSDAFGKAIWYKVGGHMGGVDYHDIIAGIDALIKDGFVDESRMAVTGGSYGGYLTNWIISQNNRFAAAVSMYGIFSLLTDFSNSWQPSWEKMYLGIYYWEQPITMENPYIKYSPAFHVKNIHTPVLILHGEKDRYTNLANSQEMYQALHLLGRTVKFVIYPREGHGISREPNHLLDTYLRSKRWFDKYLVQK